MKTSGYPILRVFVAALIGPLALIPALALFGLVAYAFNPIYPLSLEWGEILLLFSLAGLLIAYPVTLLLGLPIALILNSLNLLNLLTILFTAFAIACYFTAVWFQPYYAWLAICYFSLAVAFGCWNFCISRR